MPDFFSRLSYSLGNEDWETEHRALQIRPGDRTICVTGSGDRALHCLLAEGALITAIDANPVQNHLLELKIAALRTLDFHDYLGFLGVTPSSTRLKYLPELAQQVSERAASCWKSQPQLIEKGILYQGYVERRCKVLATWIEKLRGKKVERLFESNNIEEQSRFVDSEWNSWSWKTAFNVVFHPRLRLAKRWLRDPGLYEQIGPRLHVGRYLHGRINDYLHRGLARESIIMCLFLLGKVKPESLPPYLTASGWEAIRERLDHLTVKTGDMIHYLEHAQEGSIDRFSMSDIASYMTESDFHRLTTAMVRAAAPGARFCIRQFLSHHRIPEKLTKHLHRDMALEQELKALDRCFVYEYMVGTIHK